MPDERSREFMSQQLAEAREMVARGDLNEGDLRKLLLRRSVIESWESLMDGDPSHHHDGGNHHDHTSAMLGGITEVSRPPELRGLQQNG